MKSRFKTPTHFTSCLLSACVLAVVCAQVVQAQQDSSQATRSLVNAQAPGAGDSGAVHASPVQPGAHAAVEPTSTQTNEATSQAAPQEAVNPLKSAALAAAISTYKSHPDSSSWGAVLKELNGLLGQPAALKAAAASIIQANPGLTEVGARVVDAGGARIWSFPRISESQTILLTWQNFVVPPPKVIVVRRRKVVVPSTPIVVGTRMQQLTLPATITLRDARIVHATTASPGGKLVGTRYLILTGSERTGGTIWLQSLKQGESGWIDSPSVLSAVPAYLVQNVAGKASFSGSDLVLSLSAGDSSPPQSSGYKIVLKLVSGRYVVENQPSDEPLQVVLQFTKALQMGRQDIARAWLADPKLISIVKYLGLANRGDKPFKVIGMSAPLLNGARFRVMTFDKDDLVVDVGKIRVPPPPATATAAGSPTPPARPQWQWAIKGLFIAPPDPLAQKLVGSSVSAVEPKPASAPKPASDGDGHHAAGTVAPAQPTKQTPSSR